MIYRKSLVACSIFMIVTASAQESLAQRVIDGLFKPKGIAACNKDIASMQKQISEYQSFTISNPPGQKVASVSNVKYIEQTNKCTAQCSAYDNPATCTWEPNYWTKTTKLTWQ